MDLSVMVCILILVALCCVQGYLIYDLQKRIERLEEK